jgi:hypothetical protein
MDALETSTLAAEVCFGGHDVSISGCSDVHKRRTASVSVVFSANALMRMCWSVMPRDAQKCENMMSIDPDGYVPTPRKKVNAACGAMNLVLIDGMKVLL